MGLIGFGTRALEAAAVACRGLSPTHYPLPFNFPLQRPHSNRIYCFSDYPRREASCVYYILSLSTIFKLAPLQNTQGMSIVAACKSGFGWRYATSLTVSITLDMNYYSQSNSFLWSSHREFITFITRWRGEVDKRRKITEGYGGIEGVHGTSYTCLTFPGIKCFFPAILSF